MRGIICRQVGIAAAFLLLVATGMPCTAHASAPAETKTSKSALAVSPAIIEDVLTPGLPVPFTVQVHNITNFPLPIKSFVRGLTVEENTDLNKDEQARLDSSQWFAIAEPDFILQPGQVRTVAGTIKTPADAIPGGHYATIFFQPLVPQEALSPSMAYVNARVGVLAFLIVKGDITQKASLKKGLQTAGLVQGGPIGFTFSIYNSGNVHVLPAGKLVIHDMFGKQVATQNIPAGIILPNSTRQYTIKWDGPALPGMFKADLTLSYGADNAKLPQTAITFWVVPWAGLLAAGVSLAVGVLAVLKTRRRWRRAWGELRSAKRHT